MGCSSSKGAASNIQPAEHSSTAKGRNANSAKDEPFPGTKGAGGSHALPPPPAAGSMLQHGQGGAGDGTVHSDCAGDDDDEAIEKIRAYLVRASVSDGFGFGIGLTTGNEIFITDLLDTSSAAKSLHIADRVDRINGAAVSTMAFQTILSQVSTSLVLMLACSRLRMLQAAPPPDTNDSDSDSDSAPRRLNSIASILPDVKLVTRRPSVGRASISRPPSLEPLKEEKDSSPEGAGPGAASSGPARELAELSVTLKRSASTDTYGFGLAASSDNKLYIYKISSNIYNWGMLQVGDRVTSINGVAVAATATAGGGGAAGGAGAAVHAGAAASPVDCEGAAALINGGNEVTLGLVRQVKQTVKAEVVSTRGSLALAVPPRLLMSRLSQLKQERAAEESKQAKSQQSGADHDNDAEGGHADQPDTKQSSPDLSFAQSIANIISTAGL